MPDPVLLHVGYIKTATTFLQNQVFTDPAAGLELAAGKQTRSHLVQEIVLSDDYAFDPDATRNRLEHHAREVRARGSFPIWSEEMLLGNPPAQRYDGFANARKLHLVYPEAKVLITIRRQIPMALSIWGEYVRGGGRLPLSAVIGTGAELPGHMPVLHPEFLLFDRAIRHYQGLFGADRVLVLPQEMLAQDHMQYYAALSEFVGRTIKPEQIRRQAHVAEGEVVMRVRRALNRLISIDPTRKRRQGAAQLNDRVLRRIDHMVPAAWNRPIRLDLQAQVTARYDGLFAQSNRRTGALTGLNLEAFGYEM